MATIANNLHLVADLCDQFGNSYIQMGNTLRKWDVLSGGRIPPVPGGGQGLRLTPAQRRQQTRQRGRVGTQTAGV
jgi:hypothetical protein